MGELAELRYASSRLQAENETQGPGQDGHLLCTLRVGLKLAEGGPGPRHASLSGLTFQSTLR